MPDAYAHLAVRTDRERVAAALGGQLAALPGASGAHVGPTEDRWCGVVLAGGTGGTGATGDTGGTVAAALSTALGVPVLRARVGGDALELRLYVYGGEVVAYAAAGPGRPAVEPVVGVAAERLVDATAARALPEDLVRVLAGDFPDPGARYAELLSVLGLPGYLLGAGVGPACPPGFVTVGAGER